jgi:hypothetical protein
MGRRFALVVSALVLAVATLGSGTAHAAAVVASGTLHCSITGRVTLTPGIGLRVAPADVVLRGQVRGTCTGTSGVTGMRGKFRGFLPSPPLPPPPDTICVSDLQGFTATLGPMRFTGAAARYAHSSATFSSSEVLSSSGTLTVNLPAGGSSFVPSGSFGGQDPTMTMVLDQSAGQTESTCLLGRKGLRKLTFGGASSFDID